MRGVNQPGGCHRDRTIVVRYKKKRNWVKTLLPAIPRANQMLWSWY